MVVKEESSAAIGMKTPELEDIYEETEPVPSLLPQAPPPPRAVTPSDLSSSYETNTLRLGKAPADEDTKSLTTGAESSPATKKSVLMNEHVRQNSYEKFILIR